MELWRKKHRDPSQLWLKPSIARFGTCQQHVAQLVAQNVARQMAQHFALRFIARRMHVRMRRPLRGKIVVVKF